MFKPTVTVREMKPEDDQLHVLRSIDRKLSLLSLLIAVLIVLLVILPVFSR